MLHPDEKKLLNDIHREMRNLIKLDKQFKELRDAHPENADVYRKVSKSIVKAGKCLQIAKLDVYSYLDE